MTEAEYLDVILAYTEAFNTVFNFWLTITFSCLVAFYFIASKLDRKLSRGLIALYTVASAIFTLRYLVLTLGTGRFNQRMIAEGYEGIYAAFPGQQLISIGGTLALMIVGTVLAVGYSIWLDKSTK
ncbi:MAG: hypothetical protein DHS20C12_06750 [Pseudohongiella sp.]|nr:MAG: hypothetical protein DHS20C12_06750 [Pseudohongiella sp.]